ncbi:DUF6968 family protein [Xanthobacter aminoxidans]|uniref:DUF6968 family protein n=1 Tax=Xanthobacter aminoxidans TaxID=186280 RepID=UPI00372D2B4D
MLILTHTLHLNGPSGDVPIEIRLYQPHLTDGSWTCSFEIDWPGPNGSPWRGRRCVAGTGHRAADDWRPDLHEPVS